MVSNRNLRERFASEKKSSGSTMKTYGVAHSFLSLMALFVCFKCMKKYEGFNKLYFIFACCCPHIFLIFIFATKGVSCLCKE